MTLMTTSAFLHYGCRERKSVTYGRPPPDISQRLIEILGLLQVAVQSWNP